MLIVALSIVVLTVFDASGRIVYRGLPSDSWQRWGGSDDGWVRRRGATLPRGEPGQPGERPGRVGGNPLGRRRRGTSCGCHAFGPLAGRGIPRGRLPHR